MKKKKKDPKAIKHQQVQHDIDLAEGARQVDECS